MKREAIALDILMVLIQRAPLEDLKAIGIRQNLVNQAFDLADKVLIASGKTGGRK